MSSGRIQVTSAALCIQSATAFVLLRDARQANWIRAAAALCHPIHRIVGDVCFCFWVAYIKCWTRVIFLPQAPSANIDVLLNWTFYEAFLKASLPISAKQNVFTFRFIDEIHGHFSARKPYFATLLSHDVMCTDYSQYLKAVLLTWTAFIILALHNLWQFIWLSGEEKFTARTETRSACTKREAKSPCCSVRKVSVCRNLHNKLM